MSQWFIGNRKKNGQIGCLSESMSFPEVIDLVRPKEASNVCVLVNFFPLIEALHNIHTEHVERSIRAEYNAVYNYWLDATSFSDKAVLISKSEALAKSSNDFLTTMDFRIDDTLTKFRSRRLANLSENYKLVQEFGRDVDAYIDILLCYVHSKASLEIASFKRDYVLTKYTSSIIDKIKKAFFDIVEYNDQSDSLDRASILNFLALQKHDELDSYLKILPEPHNSRDLKSELFENAEINDNYDDFDREMGKKLEIKFREPDEMEMEMVKILRDLVMKAQTISSLIEVLKTKDVEWDASNDSVSDLVQLIDK